MEKYHLIQVQSEDGKNLNEIGSDESCDIVLRIDKEIEPLHVKINVDSENDIGIEDVSHHSGIIKEKNGIKFNLKKHKEYEFLSGRYFYLNPCIKISLIEGTYEELMKQIPFFEYYVNSLNFHFKDNEKIEEIDLNNLNPTIENISDDLPLEFEDNYHEQIAPLDIKEIITPEELLNFNEQNPIDIEEFNDFENYKNNRNEEIDEEININAIVIDKELKNLNNLENNELYSRSEAVSKQSYFYEENLYESENQQNRENRSLEDFKLEIENAKIIDSLLPNLKDKSLNPQIEEIIRNSQYESNYEDILDEEEQILEEIEEKLEEKTKQNKNEGKHLDELDENIEENHEEFFNKKTVEQIYEQFVEKLEEKINKDKINEDIKIQEENEEKLSEGKEEKMSGEIIEEPKIELKEEAIPELLTDIIANRIKDKGINMENPEGSLLNQLSGKKSKVKNKDKLLSNKRLRVDDDIKENIKEEKAEIIKSRKNKLKEESDEESEKYSKTRKNKIIEESEEEIEIPKRNKRKINKIEIEEEEVPQPKKKMLKNIKDYEEIEEQNTPLKRGRKSKKVEESYDEEDEEVSYINNAKNPKKVKKTKHLEEEYSGEEEEIPKGKNIKSNLSSKQNTETKKSIKDKSTSLNPYLKISFVDDSGLKSKIIKQMRTINCERVDEDADVFLCEKLSKNTKLLIAINNRKPILSFKWLEDSISSKKIKPFDKYCLKDKDFEKKFHFELQKLLHNDPYASHLEGYTFYVTDHVYNKDEIEEIIESAGGTHLQSLKNNKKAKDIIIIADKSHDRDEIKVWKASKYNYEIYNADLILDSVYTQILDFNKNKYKI